MALGLFEIIFKASGANKVQSDIKAIKDEAGSAAPAVEQLAGTMSKLGRIGATLGALGGIVAFGKSALEASGDAQELNTRLEGVTGSAAEAAKVMAKVREVAGPSPFTTKQLANAAVGLQAMGINAQKALPKLADLGAAFGADEEHLKSLVGMMGKLNQGIMPDSETLSMFGLSKKDFAGEGITFDKNGTLISSATETLDALFRIIDKKYGGMTERMAKNTKSQMASIVDSFMQMMEKVGNIFGAGLSLLTPAITDGLGKVTKFFDSVTKDGSAAQNILKGIAATLALITAVQVVDGIIMLSKVMKGLANTLKLVAAGEALIQALSGPAGVAKVVFGVAAAGLAIWGMDAIFNQMEQSAKTKPEKLKPPTTTDPMTGATGGGTVESNKRTGLIGAFETAVLGAAKVSQFQEEWGKTVAESLDKIAKNTGTTNDLLDLRRQTFGGGALGRLGATAVEMREANGGGGIAAGTGRIPNTLIPYNIDLERGVKKIFAAEYRTQAVNLMRRI